MKLPFKKSPVRKKDVATFLESLAFLVSCGYTAYDAVYWISRSTDVKRSDKETTAVNYIANALLGDLSEGFPLSHAMQRNPEIFGSFAKQIAAAEHSGRTVDVISQIVANIRDSDSMTKKIKSAMVYPTAVLSITFGIAWYLFSYVIPDLLEMLTEVGNGEIPHMTQMVMDYASWMKVYGSALMLLIVAAIAVCVFLAKGPTKIVFDSLYTRLPFIKKISLSSNVCTWMRSLRYMLLAGSPMASALAAAADAMANSFLRKQANSAQMLYASSGIPVPEALRECKFLSTMEINTINIGLESGEVENILERLADRRYQETERSISAFIALLNPVLICILGVIVGVIVLAVYGPILNITQTITT